MRTDAVRMTPAGLSAVLVAHYQTHQALPPQDVYKLLYQSVFGPEHSLQNKAAAVQALYLEALHLPSTPTTLPLLEPLSPVLCRVNLQPFMQHGGNLRALWRLFWRTAQEYQPGTLTDLAYAWQLFVTTPWARQYEPASLEQFWQQMATANFPPVHHSHAYAAANAPHYRVVLRVPLVALLHG
jgi:hypothetical protein